MKIQAEINEIVNRKKTENSMKFKLGSLKKSIKLINLQSDYELTKIEDRIASIRNEQDNTATDT